ncbi:MAG: SMC-Scp complex subunit ScpB [Planctomycetia bacterium]|nr:SMC-Scp complex subunit ScpB [Planctomycetia bacterium]
MSDTPFFQHPEWEVIPDRRGEAEISLDALRDAFASALATSPSSTTEREGTIAEREEAPTGEDGAGTSASGQENSTESVRESPGVSPEMSDNATGSLALDEEEEEYRRLSPHSILEAMLFTGGPGGRPLTAACACGSMRGVTSDEIPGYVAQLNAKYARSGRAFEIILSGNGYRLALRPEYAPVRSLFQGRVREAKLSQAAVQVLAIVAWRQPITADEVTSLRDGAPSQSLLSQLVRRRLLQIERPEGERVAVYRTTERFLELFHIRSLADLPQSDDF